MNRARVWLLLYVVGVIGATLVHDPRILAAGLSLILILAGREAGSILLRTLKTVLVFNLAVSLGYILLAALRHISPWDTLLLLNLRVLTIACLSFLFIARVNLFQALGFSPALSYLLGLAYSQALGFRRMHEDFRLALASRSLERPSLRDRYRASAASVSWLLDKGLAGARQTALALRARGFFND